MNTVYFTPGLPGLDAFIREKLADQIAEAVWNCGMMKLEAELAASRQTLRNQKGNDGK